MSKSGACPGGVSSHGKCCKVGAAPQNQLDWSITPTAATALAVSTDGSQEAIDHLDGTEYHLDPSNDQQNGEEGQIPGDHILGLCALAPQGLVIKIITIMEGVSPCAVAHEAFRTPVDGDSWDDKWVSSTQESNHSKQCGGEHRKSLPAALIATASTAVIVFQAQEHHRREDHQDSAPQDSSEVPDLFWKVVVVIYHLSSGEEQQDIRQEAKHSQGNEGAPQALGTAPSTHAGVAK